MKISRLERIVVLGIGAALATLIACGSADDDSVASGADGGSSGSSGTGSSSGGPFFGDGGSTLPAKGVILVHAAVFPSMRLCFENYPDIPPQPDRKVLPQANVVGVDLGGLVRLGPMLTKPGKVFIIPQKAVAAVPGDKTEQTCGDYLKTHDVNFGWYRAGELTEPVGVDHAEVLAITGCGPSAFLDQLNVDEKECGPAFNTTAAHSGGLFAVQRLKLNETITATQQTLPMTLVNMAPLLKPPTDQNLDVSFGDLDAGPSAQLATPVPTPAVIDADGGASFSEGKSVTLPLDQSKESVFGLSGFRIAYRDQKGVANPASAGGLVVDQTLAQIQASSRSDGNPTSYYVASSNFVFFLLGDPRMQRSFSDGGTNPSFDARRAVHLLAVPVRDDNEATPLGDAGAAAATDAGDAGDGGVK